MTGHLRESRGHRHVGGLLGQRRPLGLGEHRERHVGAVIGAIAAIISAYATYSASEQAAAANRYNAKVAKNQAINAENAAGVEIANRREVYRRQMAAQRAAIGASGIEPDEGSPLLVQMDSAEQAALDLARVKYAGDVRSTVYQSEAKLQKFYAKSNVRQGYISAGASLMQGAASVYGIYAKNHAGGSTSASDYGQSGAT
jgi:hypothetical protein